MSALNDYMCLVDRMTVVASRQIERYHISGLEVTTCGECNSVYPTEWLIDGDECPFCGDAICPEEEDKE